MSEDFQLDYNSIKEILYDCSKTLDGSSNCIGTDDLILNYIDNLLEENNQLRKQYCERTDCGGRLGNSKKVEELIEENERLKEENLKLAEENIDLRTYIYVEKASFKSDGKNFYEIMEMPTYEELQEKNQKLKEKNTIYKSTIKGQYNKIKELQNSKRISKKVHKERKRKLQEENQQLKDDLHQASISIKELIERDIECPASCHRWNTLKKWLQEILIKWKNWYSNDLSSHDRRYYEKEYNYKMSAYEDVLEKISKLEEGNNE